MPPEVAAGLHGDGRAGAAKDDYVLYGGAVEQSFIDDRFELDFGAAAKAGVLGEDGDATGVVDAVRDGVGCEAAEDDGVDGSDAGAGKQRDGQFGAHTYVDGDPVSAPNAKAFEDVGEALHLLVEFAVGELAHFSGLSLPEESDFVPAAAESVTIDAVVREVELAVDEPSRMSGFAFGDCGPGGKPVKFRGCFGPELIRMLHAATIHALVLIQTLDVGFCRKLR